MARGVVGCLDLGVVVESNLAVEALDFLRSLKSLGVLLDVLWRLLVQ